MNRRARSTAGALAPLLAAATFGCSPAPHAPALDGREELLRREAEFAAAVAAKEPERFAAFLAEDAVSLGPSGGMAIGRDAVIAEWQSLLDDPGLQLEWRPIQAEVSADRSLGYTFGTWKSSRRDETGEARLGTGRYLTIWRRTGDGAWIVAVDIGNADAPPHPDLTF